MASDTSTSSLIFSSLGDDPDSRDLVDMYVEEMPERISALVATYEAGDYKKLGRLVNQMKGSVGSYGFDQLSPYAAELEVALREAESDEIVYECLRNVIEKCKRVRSGTPG